MAAGRIFHAPNLISICVNEIVGEDFRGELWHQYSGDSVAFSGSMDMLVQMDQLYDSWDFPQRSTRQRFFGQNPKRTPAPRRPKIRIEQRRKYCSIEDLYAKRGTIATFIIFVEYRQNASWQGRISWLEEGTHQQFSSALELIRMLSAVAVRTGDTKG